MYAIRSKKTKRWFHGINSHVGSTSSLRIEMDDVVPILFHTKEMARIELLLHHMSSGLYEIIEVDLFIKESSYD
ncbi:hypothetical protein WKT02_01680 [Erysipelotrichaceae bacterium HCN-30851]